MIRLAPLLLLLAGCRGDANVLGYTTAPPFDAGVRTVYVPVFKNAAFQTTPHRGIEVDVTQAVVKEINTRTPMRVVSDPERADTELLGTVLKIEKNLLNRNQQNLAREEELSVTVSVVWRDLRTGQILSNRRPAKPDLPLTPNFDPSLPPPPEAPVKEQAQAVTLVATGRVLPEVGESTATGQKSALDQIARQVVNMMEKPW